MRRATAASINDPSSALKNEYVVRAAVGSRPRSHPGATVVAATAPESFRNERREIVVMKMSGNCAPDRSQAACLQCATIAVSQRFEVLSAYYWSRLARAMPVEALETMAPQCSTDPERFR